MKKFIIISCVVVLLIFAGNIAYYNLGIYIDLNPNTPVTTFMTTDQDTIYMEKNGQKTCRGNGQLTMLLMRKGI